MRQLPAWRGVGLALALLMALAPASCSPSGATGSPTPTGLPPSPVDGAIVHIDSAGLSDVRGFDLRTADAKVVAFTLGPLENGAQFAPGHLAEHEATGAPVRVFYRIANGTPVVYRLEDAPTLGGSPLPT